MKTWHWILIAAAAAWWLLERPRATIVVPTGHDVTRVRYRL